MNKKFDLLLDGEVVDSVKWYEIGTLDKMVGQENVQNYYFSENINGVEYEAHYWFFNTEHESSVFGVLLLDYSGENDVEFGIYGNKVDHICSFDEMMKYLADEQYFID